MKGFPKRQRLHPFERALLDLTVGTAHYERTMMRVDALRKGALELGKGHAGFANRAVTETEAEARRRVGFAELEALFQVPSSALIVPSFCLLGALLCPLVPLCATLLLLSILPFSRFPGLFAVVVRDG